MFDDILAHHGVVIAVSDFSVIAESALADDESNTFSRIEDLAEICHHFCQLFSGGILSDDKRSDLHVLEKLDGDFTLIFVLRFIMYARLTSPADDKDRRDRIASVAEKRSYRIDDVSFSAVLHINYRNFAGSEVIACCKRSAVSFVGSDHVMLRIDPVCVHKIIAQCLEL